jgi:hypothetical protein
MMTTIGNEYHVTGGQSATDNSSVGIFHVPSMLSSILRRAVSRIGSAPPRPAYLQKGEQLRRQAAQWYDAQTSSVSARPLAKQALANVILAVTASLNGTATQALRANRRVRDVLTSPMLPQDAQQELSASWPGAVGPDAVSAAMQDQLFSVPDDHIVVQSNDSVQLFLEQQGYKTDDVLDATLLCKAAVDALVKDPQVAPSLARHILKGLACYGGSIREPVSGQYQAAVIRRWVELQLFEGDIEAFIAADWPCRQVSLERELADLGNLIRRHIFAHLLAHDTEAAGYRPDVVLKSWIWNKVVLALVPVLRYVNSEQDGGLPLRGSEWGHINAGLLFAQRAGLELDDVSLYQALDLGKMLHLQLAGEVLPIEWQRLFRLPALCRAAGDAVAAPGGQADSQGNSSLTQHYLLATKSLVATHEQWFRPLQQLLPAMANFRTRPELAKDKLGAEATPGEVLSLLNTGKVNQAYQQQVDVIAASYEQYDRVRLGFAWARLSEDELKFISAAEISRVRAVFSAFDAIRGQRIASSRYARQGLTKNLLEHVELFAATCGAQERIYVQEFDGAAYFVQRIDRIARNYQRLMKDDGLALGHDYRLKIYPQGAVLQPPQDMLAALCQMSAASHRGDFSRQLHALGYEMTSREKLIEIALGFVPLYTCVTESRKGQVDAAVLACGIDVLTLLPLLGASGKLLANIVQVGTRGSWTVLRKAAQEMTVHGLSKKMLLEGGADIASHVLLPTQQLIGRHEMASLGVAALRVIDPGVELFWHLEGVVAKLSIALGRHMESHLRALGEVLPRLGRKQTERVASVPVADLLFVRVPGLDDEVPMASLAGVKYKKQPVYTRVDLESGMQYGRKYYLAEGGTLQPVPVPLLRKFEQGLSGRGAPRAGQQWAAADGNGQSGRQLADLAASSGQTRTAASEQVGTPVTSVHLEAWGAFSEQQRRWIGLRNFCAGHGINCQEFSTAWARQSQVAHASRALPAGPVQVPELLSYRPVTAELLQEWMRNRSGKSTELQKLYQREFLHEKRLDIREWVRFVGNDLELTHEGRQLLAQVPVGSPASALEAIVLSDTSSALSEHGIAPAPLIHQAVDLRVAASHAVSPVGRSNQAMRGGSDADTRDSDFGQISSSDADSGRARYMSSDVDGSLSDSTGGQSQHGSFDIDNTQLLRRAGVGANQSPHMSSDTDSNRAVASFSDDEMWDWSHHSAASGGGDAGAS